MSTLGSLNKVLLRYILVSRLDCVVLYTKQQLLSVFQPDSNFVEMLQSDHHM